MPPQPPSLPIAEVIPAVRAALAAQEETGRVVSLMYQHRVGIARVLSLGLNRGHQQPGAVRTSEVFAKATLGY